MCTVGASSFTFSAALSRQLDERLVRVADVRRVDSTMKSRVDTGSRKLGAGPKGCPAIGLKLTIPPSSRTIDVPEVRKHSLSGSEHRLVIAPGLARRPNRPETSQRRRLRTCAATGCSVPGRLQKRGFRSHHAVHLARTSVLQRVEPEDLGLYQSGLAERQGGEQGLGVLHPWQLEDQ